MFIQKEVPIRDRTFESTLHAIQTWVALPEAEEESDPWFRHYPAKDIPTWTKNGVSAVLIAGKFGARQSPVKSASPIIYLDLSFTTGGKFVLAPDYTERAVYSITKGIYIDGEELEQHRLAILAADREVKISASTESRCMVIGGESLGKRHKWWNFVSSSLDRIESAKQDWQGKKFPQVPQENEFIPLPQE